MTKEICRFYRHRIKLSCYIGPESETLDPTIYYGTDLSDRTSLAHRITLAYRITLATRMTRIPHMKLVSSCYA